MAKYHVTIPDDVLRDAQARGVKIPAACREGLAARTYGPAVLVPAAWYEMALSTVGGEGPGVDPPSLWSREGFSEQISPARPGRSDQDQLEGRLDQLSKRVDGTEGKLRAVATYAAITTGLLVVGGVVVYASTR